MKQKTKQHEQEVVFQENQSNASKSKKKCLNKNKDCDFWAQYGECTKNPNWMLDNCRRACCTNWPIQNECIFNQKRMQNYCINDYCLDIC